MEYQFDLVGKIGSMALIRREDNDIDYNIFARLGAELKPGMIWVTSGAAESFIHSTLQPMSIEHLS